MQALAIAQPNVALVKYWGKRDAALNLPAVGSISVTLRGLTTRTRVEFAGDLTADELLLNGAPAPQALRRAVRILDLIRARARHPLHARIASENDFPTGAGLASSASGFAALVLAASAAAGLSLTPAELSRLARLGSGSAARSIFGGFVEMQAGVREDGEDAVAAPLLDAQQWPLAVLVAITSLRPKQTSSTDGMELTRATSPYWRAWLDSSSSDLSAMRAAVLARDLAQVGELAEHSCLKMHALAMAARPGLIFWSSTTVALMHVVRDLRRAGTPAYFTIDAGPQVKVLCEPETFDRVRTSLAATPGVERIIASGPGPGATLVEGASG